MLKMTLHDNWYMKRVGEEKEFPAVVPGSVYNDLLLNEQMEDPYYRDNEMKALKLMEYDYEYYTKFAVEKEYFDMDEVLLHFDGLDTVADIYFNGELLGSTANMHRQWDFSVKNLLKEYDNELRIIFHSPTKYIKDRYAKDPVEGSEDAMVGFPQIRKPHYMFGWDWGPRTPDAGIWRPISLLGIEKARFTGVYVRQQHEMDKVMLTVESKIREANTKEEFDVENSNLPYTVKVQVTDPDGKMIAEQMGAAPEIIMNDPELWWPNGYGKQPLYTVKAELYYESKRIDVWEKRIGLRTMTIYRQKDEYGESFAHRVNGVDIFAMGADYIPEDNILSRINKERTRNLLEQCVAGFHVCMCGISFDRRI